MNNMPSTSRFVYNTSDKSLTLDNPRFMKSIDYTTLPTYTELVENFDPDDLSEYLTKYDLCVSNDEFELSIFNARKYNYPADMVAKMVDAAEDQATSYISELQDYLSGLQELETLSSQVTARGFRDIQGHIKAIDFTKTRGEEIESEELNIVINEGSFFDTTDPTVVYDVEIRGGVVTKFVALRTNSTDHYCDIFINYGGLFTITNRTLCMMDFEYEVGKNALPFYVDTLGVMPYGDGNSYPCVRLQLDPRAANHLDSEAVAASSLRLSGAIFKDRGDDNE